MRVRPLVPALLRPAHPGGRLIAFGASAVTSGEKKNLVTAAKAALRMPRFNLIKQMSASESVIGFNMLRLWEHAGRCGPGSTRCRAAGGRHDRAGGLRAFPFDRAADAHRMIAERRNLGKVVLTP